METRTTDINSLIKRLEMLKSSIALNDADDILYQLSKLKKSDIADLEQQIISEVNQLIQLIEKKDFGIAMKVITDMLQKFNTITKWVDPVVEGLRTEVQLLAGEISALENELADTEKVIHNFEVQHTKELGEIIMKILALRRQIAERNAKNNPTDAPAQEQYKEAQQEEQQYESNYNEALKTPMQSLTEEQLNELKSKFRKISKMTHPDLVDKQFLKEATELFIKAKKAKDDNDLAIINEILEYLETGKPFTLRHETLTEKDTLHKESIRLRQVIKQLQKKIEELKNNETYQTIITIPDWNSYFSNTKATLEIEAKKLQGQIK